MQEKIYISCFRCIYSDGCLQLLVVYVCPCGVRVVTVRSIAVS